MSTKSTDHFYLEFPPCSGIYASTCLAMCFSYSTFPSAHPISQNSLPRYFAKYTLFCFLEVLARGTITVSVSQRSHDSMPGPLALISVRCLAATASSEAIWSFSHVKALSRVESFFMLLFSLCNIVHNLAFGLLAWFSWLPCCILYGEKTEAQSVLATQCICQ
jgi:hypothetical protein